MRRSRSRPLLPSVTAAAPSGPGEPIGGNVGPEAAVVDEGAVRNTLLQLASQVATLCFSASLTLYLVRAFGPRQYGIYALAVSVAALVALPAGLGLPLSVGRFLADHRASAFQLREIFRVGLKLQVPVALAAAGGLFAAAGAIADAYGKPHLAWPLRWAALSVAGQAVFSFLTSVGAAVRRASLALTITIVESAIETLSAIGLVAAGAGVAGALLGKFGAYTIAVLAGVYLTIRLLGRRGAAAETRLVTVRSLLTYAGAMFVVDVTWTAITQIDILLIGALLGTAAVGSFGAVLRVLTVAGYLGMAVASGVAPRISLGGGNPDVRSFEVALRYVTIIQGLVIAPMLVWSHPLVDLLLGQGYSHSAEIMRVLTLYYFIGGPAALITVGVTYLGEARRRVPIMIVTLIVGVAATYVFVRTIGVVGAAVGDDVLEVIYVSAHLWICSTLIPLDVRRLLVCAARTVLAGAAMAGVLLAFGTAHLAAWQWVGGAVAGLCAFAAALLVTRELSVPELRGAVGALRTGAFGRG